MIEEPNENEKILFELSGSKMQGRVCAHQSRIRAVEDERKLVVL